MIRADERGTGLISVMVSMVILLVALSMITSTFMGASRLTHRAANFTSAGSFAEGVMERMTSQPFDRVAATKVTNGLPRLPGAECAVSVRDAGDGLKEITVTCSWLEGQQRRKTAFSTLMARGDRR
jgi:hypothetical protein